MVCLLKVTKPERKIKRLTVISYLKENNYVATEGKIIIEKILSALDDKQISELADVFEIDFDEYDDYVEAFLDCFDFMTNDFRGFVYSLTGEIKYLFDIDIDEFGNVRR